MKKRWKSISVLCLSALLGFLMPAGTMKAAEVVRITYQGSSLTQSLGGTVEYTQYVSNVNQCVSISTGDGSQKSLFYYLDNSGLAESKSEEQLASLWQSAGEASYTDVPLGQDGKYVLYVKAENEGVQEACVRTVGMIVDTAPPAITGVQDGGVYPLGTRFGVEDDNLAAVLVNEQEVSPDEDGMYPVAANGTSCVIKAKDKAGHEITYSLTINGESGVPGDDDPIDDNGVITKNGTYSLKAGTAYRFGSGSWTLEGDSVVYSGGITFYVTKDGDYKFKHY